MHHTVERSRDDIWGEVFEGRVIFQLQKRRAVKGQETIGKDRHKNSEN